MPKKKETQPELYIVGRLGHCGVWLSRGAGRLYLLGSSWLDKALTADGVSLPAGKKVFAYHSDVLPGRRFDPMTPLGEGSLVGQVC